jgi:fused signal recognition particle receptor
LAVVSALVLDTDRPIDDALLEELEELLIAADLGAPLAADFTNRAREELMFGTVTRASHLRPLFRRFLLDTLAPSAQPLSLDHHPGRRVVARRQRLGQDDDRPRSCRSLKGSGKARAPRGGGHVPGPPRSSQLERWGERIDVEVIRQAAGSDPGAGRVRRGERPRPPATSTSDRRYARAACTPRRT